MVSTPLYSLKPASLKLAPTMRMVGRCTFQEWGGGGEPPLPRFSGRWSSGHDLLVTSSILPLKTGSYNLPHTPLWQWGLGHPQGPSQLEVACCLYWRQRQERTQIKMMNLNIFFFFHQEPHDWNHGCIRSPELGVWSHGFSPTSSCNLIAWTHQV